MMGVLSTGMLLEGQSNDLCVLFCKAVELQLNEGLKRDADFVYLRV